MPKWIDDNDAQVFFYNSDLIFPAKKFKEEKNKYFCKFKAEINIESKKKETVAKEQIDELTKQLSKDPKGIYWKKYRVSRLLSD